MEYVKLKLNVALMAAFTFLLACNGGGWGSYWNRLKMIDINAHNVEKRLAS